MKVLILGGNRFVGKRVAKLLVDNVHQVTLLNRGNLDDGLGAKVERIQGDKKELSTLVGSRFFDVVIDQICMSGDDAKNVVSALSHRINHYVITSTMAVYPQKAHLAESDFQPENYLPQKATTPLEVYSEAKRSAEHILATTAPFTWSVARFPIIFSGDDPTRRLYEEVQKIKNNEGVCYENTEAFFSFIHADDAARALYNLAIYQYPGAYNFASEASIKLKEFLEIISKEVGMKFRLDDTKAPSPFSIKNSWTMNVEKSLSIGCSYQKISDWLPKLIS